LWVLKLKTVNWNFLILEAIINGESMNNRSCNMTQTNRDNSRKCMPLIKRMLSGDSVCNSKGHPYLVNSDNW